MNPNFSLADSPTWNESPDYYTRANLTFQVTMETVGVKSIVATYAPLRFHGNQHCRKKDAVPQNLVIETCRPTYHKITQPSHTFFQICIIPQFGDLA